MEGPGVTTYDINKPSHAFTTETSEFDDALLKRNIITFEQAMMAKGASYQEAQRLAQLRESQEANTKTNFDWRTQSDSSTNETETDSGAHEEDSELKEYRLKRLTQLQHGDVIPISRTDWNEQVNDSSHSQWVVILLTSQSSAPNLNPYHLELCHKLEQIIIPHLAGKFHEVKWVRIPSQSAIENWPDDNLPTLFCYRHGKLQHQLVGLGDFEEIDEDYVEFKLGRMGVLETDVEVIPRRKDRLISNNPVLFGSKFQGGMSTFATTADMMQDYDDID